MFSQNYVSSNFMLWHEYYQSYSEPPGHRVFFQATRKYSLAPQKRSLGPGTQKTLLRTQKTQTGSKKKVSNTKETLPWTHKTSDGTSKTLSGSQKYFLPTWKTMGKLWTFFLIIDIKFLDLVSPWANYVSLTKRFFLLVLFQNFSKLIGPMQCIVDYRLPKNPAYGMWEPHLPASFTSSWGASWTSHWAPSHRVQVPLAHCVESDNSLT